MSERINPDGSVSVGILEDMKPIKAEVKETKEEPAEKPKKKATKKK